MNHKYLGDEGFQTWLNDLNDVILEDGFEENEFTIYADHWHPYYTKAIPPLEAWQTVTKQNVLLDVQKQENLK